ncbi:MAG: hypothetical protein AAF998_19815 [Bacteroidota bacterium]
MNFKPVLNALEAHPEIEVTRGILLPGISETALRQVETAYGGPLKPEIRDFYRHHNGVVIEWIWQGSDLYEAPGRPREDAELPFVLDLLNDYSPPLDGQLILLPLEEVLVPDFEEFSAHSDFGTEIAYAEYLEPEDASLAGPAVQFGERRYRSEEDFRAQWRYFDFYLRDSGAVLLYEGGQPDPTVLFVETSWSRYDPARQLPLSAYLNRVYQDLGFRWRRHKYFETPADKDSDASPAERLAELLENYPLRRKT